MDNPLISSPFEPVLGGRDINLPKVFQKQFLSSVDNDIDIILAGKMDKVWHRPAWLRPFFWLLAWPNILFPETGSNIPCEMIIIGRRDKNGQAFQKWNRTFHFDKKKRYFNAIMMFDEKRQAVMERFGSVKFLVVLWEIEFISPSMINITTKGTYFTLRRHWIRLPFAPIVKVFERAINDNTLHINLEISSSFLGAVFGYEGTFIIQES